MPPVFPLCKNSAAVTALLGTDPCRVFEFGEADQATPYPYATWQMISGTPENYLNTAPDADHRTVQIDVWALNSADVLAPAKAIRDALQKSAYVVSWRSTQRDHQTKAYRFSFDVAFTTLR